MNNKIYTGTGIIDPKEMEDIIRKEENIVVVDSTEIYLKKYYKELTEKGYSIKILNLKEPNKSDLFNLFDYPYYLYKNNRRNDAIDLIIEIANIITYVGEKSDPFWSIMAANLISGITLALFDDAKIEEINLISVYKMLGKFNESFNNTDKLTEYFKLKDENDKAKTVISSVINTPKDTKLSIAAIAGSKTNIFVNDFYNAPINECNIKIKDFEKKKQALFIINNIKTKSTIISALLNELLYSQKINNPKCNVYISNLNTIEYIVGLDEFLQTCTYNNIRLFVNIGSKALFNKKYNTDLDDLEIFKTIDLINLKNHINYPKTKSISTVRCFDLDKYFKDNNIVSNGNISLDDLINKIDRDIEQIEKEEQKKRNSG